jgi:hypothetical protein
MSWPIKYIKGAPPGLKRLTQVTSDSATNAEKIFKYEKKKRPEWIFNVKWCEGRPWLKYDRDENVMTCTICIKYGKRGENGNLKNKPLFITNNFQSSAISDHEKSKGHLDALCIEQGETNYMLSEISVKVFRSSKKLVGPAETDRTYCPAVIIFFLKNSDI